MKNTPNLKNYAGMTLMEVTLTVTLVLSLIVILVIGAQAYRRGAQAVTCITQQQRVMKMGIGALMNDLAGLDSVGTEAQRYATINNFYNALGTTNTVSSTLTCPGAPKSLSRSELLMGIFLTDDEEQIEYDYGANIETLLTDWYGSYEDALTSQLESMASYSFGYAMDYSGDISYNNYLRDSYHTTYQKLSRTSMIFVACNKNWYSYGVPSAKGNRLEYHANNW